MTPARSASVRPIRSTQPGHSRQRCVRHSSCDQNLEPGSTHLHWPHSGLWTRSWRLSCSVPRCLYSER